MKKSMKFQDVIVDQDFQHNGKEFRKQSRTKGYDKAADWALWFAPDTVVTVEVEEKQAQANAISWKDEPATVKQIDYLRLLGVNVNKPITKGIASALIESVKSGNGVGSFGFSMTDGSN